MQGCTRGGVVWVGSTMETLPSGGIGIARAQTVPDTALSASTGHSRVPAGPLRTPGSSHSRSQHLRISGSQDLRILVS